MQFSCYTIGSGKTYTFFGPEGAIDEDLALPEDLSASISSSNIETGAEQICLPETTGMVVRTCIDLLRARAFMARKGINVSYSAEFVEIYGEETTDLLSGNRVTIRRETGEVIGAMRESLDSIGQVLSMLRTGHARKRFASTQMNDRSSRSHTVFLVHVSQKINTECIDVYTSAMSSTNDKLVRSSLHLVDLAGSERVKKSQVTGSAFRETVGINSSLLVLAKVISALAKGQTHVPYFESKLTTLLKAAFGGNSQTIVFVNCRSDDDNADETLESLRFGERCAMISNALKQAASSYSTAMNTIDTALASVEAQIRSLEARNKQHLKAYVTLVASHRDLQRKRSAIHAVLDQKLLPKSVKDTKEVVPTHPPSIPVE